MNGRWVAGILVSENILNYLLTVGGVFISVFGRVLHWLTTIVILN